MVDALREVDTIDLGIIIDTREQKPYEYIGSSRLSLDVADYTGNHVHDKLRIERKSLPDLIGCVGSGRERFEQSLERMVIYPFRYLVLECTMTMLIKDNWAGLQVSATYIKPQHVFGSILRWSQKFGVQPMLCGNRQNGRLVTAKLIQLATRQREKDNRALAE